MKALIASTTAALALCFGLTACDRSVNVEDHHHHHGFTYNTSDHDFTPEELEPWKRDGGALREEIDAQTPRASNPAH